MSYFWQVHVASFFPLCSYLEKYLVSVAGINSSDSKVVVYMLVQTDVVRECIFSFFFLLFF